MTFRVNDKLHDLNKIITVIIDTPKWKKLTFDTFKVEVFTDKTIDLENYSYKGGFVVISAILKPAV